MPLYYNKRVVHVVTEATAGTDPGSGYTALLADVGTVMAPSGVATPRNVVRNSFSKRAPTLSQRQWSVPMQVELAGGGVSGTLQKPPMAPLLKASGMRETAGLVLTVDNASGTFVVGEQVTNTTQASENVGKVAAASTTELVLYDVENTPLDNDVMLGATSAAGCDVDTTITDAWVYQPFSDRASTPSVAMHVYVDGLRSVLTYGRSTLQLQFQHPAKPLAVFNVQGVYSTPTEVSNPAVTYSDVEAPDCFPATLSVGAFDLSGIAIEGLDFDLGNQVVSRPDIKAADALIGFEVSDRNGATMTFDPELADTLSNLNAFDAWTSRTENEVDLAIGDTAGNRIRVVTPNAIIDEVSINDRNSIAAYGLTAGLYAPNETSEDTELFLIFS